MTDRDFESEAKLQGWKPQEEFGGDTSKWVDAQTFVERGEQFVGFLKPQLDRINSQLKQQKQINQDLHAFHTKQNEKQLSEIRILETQLQAKRAKAIDDGDGQTFTQTEAQLKNLEKSKNDIKVPLSPDAPPEWFNQWTEKEPWYGSDKVATRVADGIAEELRASGTPLIHEEFMKKVAELTKLELPNKFKNKKRDSPADVEDGGNLGGDTVRGSGGKFTSLPKEAKATCERLIKQGYIKNTKEARDEYARVYSEE